MTLSISEEDKQLLSEVAKNSGYSNVSAFIRAIAQGKLAIAHNEDNTLSDRVKALEADVESLKQRMFQ